MEKYFWNVSEHGIKLPWLFIIKQLSIFDCYDKYVAWKESKSSFSIYLMWMECLAFTLIYDKRCKWEREWLGWIFSFSSLESGSSNNKANESIMEWILRCTRPYGEVYTFQFHHNANENWHIVIHDISSIFFYIFTHRQPLCMNLIWISVARQCTRGQTSII